MLPMPLPLGASKGRSMLMPFPLALTVRPPAWIVAVRFVFAGMMLPEGNGLQRAAVELHGGQATEVVVGLRYPRSCWRQGCRRGGCRCRPWCHCHRSYWRGSMDR